MSRNSAEIKRRKERRGIAATIGTCFVIVLVVLLIMSNTLTDTYTVVLETERAEAMETLAVSCSTALGHSRIVEGMTYPLPVYTYGKDKSYIFDIYTKAGNSFLRLCTTSEYNGTEQYYLSGVGDEYNNCFDLQHAAFTRRTDDGVEYVCAIAPIISAENTVAGILEVRMPYADYVSTVNGMSLSWIFTIISIAIAMAIIIYELNLLVSTMSRGISGNVPVIIMYGTEAVSFLSFFASMGAVMIPVIIPEYIKNSSLASEMPVPAVQGLIALGLLLYIAGIFGGSVLKKDLKFKLTSRIAVLVATSVGYMLSLAAGIVDIMPITLVLIPFIGFAYGMSFDSLRDYRINAGKLGYEEFSDRKIHNIQYSGYFLGVSVGAVIAGIFFERYGLLVVNILSGAVMILSCLGIFYFMRDNSPIKESYLPVSKWLELFSDKYVGRFLSSAFFSMGFLIAFLLGFIPNYLDTVGISLATSSFYYLVAAFFALFIALIVKERFAGALTSRTRVIMSSFASLLGLLLFALMPTAKILVITTALLGFGLGIHDFYYLYVLYLITNMRFKVKYNLHKLAEMSFVAGMVVALPMLGASIIFDVRTVFIIICVLYFIISFIYPMSQFSGSIDEADPSLTRNKKRKNKTSDNQPAPAVYSSEQIIIPQTSPEVDITDANTSSGIDIASFIDDLAQEDERGDSNGYLE
ncbi:MAG: MFS transporter [Clostridiales bacterium]|nr:MFS transporter [Clostridiales bacterium]